MYRYSSVLALSVVLLIALVAPFTIVQPARAQFIIASWEYPDENGQGIEGFWLYENSTGSWVVTAGPYYHHQNNELSQVFNWTAGVGIKIRVLTTLNKTLTGANDTDEGKNYQRHNVTVTNLGDIVFSQQNFTFYDVEYVPPSTLMWYYYEVVLNFLPSAGSIYTVIITYDIFYSTGEMTESTEQTATNGTGNYINSKALDSVYWSSETSTQSAYFISGLYLESFDYVCYGKHLTGTGYLSVYNGATWETLETITSGGYAWYNGSHSGDILPTFNVTLGVSGGILGTINIDYLAVIFHWVETPEWHSVSLANVYLELPVDETTFNALLIFLGLFMIPASTLYLAKGGKDELSANKFFYFCIAFMLGWGLLLGGII